MIFLATQQSIVAEIEAEQKLVERLGKMIQATLAHIWGEAKETNEER